MIALQPAPEDLARAVLAGAPVAVAHAADWPHDGSAAMLREVAEHGAPGAFLVEENGLVVGEGRLVGPPDADGEVELGYALAPSARGRGVGTALVQLLLAEAARAGACRARAEVLPGNAPSLGLLARLGFTVAGHLAGHVVLVRDVAHLAPPSST